MKESRDYISKIPRRTTKVALSRALLNHELMPVFLKTNNITDLNQRNAYGETVLHRAVMKALKLSHYRFKQYEHNLEQMSWSIALLIAKGADATIKNDYGRTPLSIAGHLLLNGIKKHLEQMINDASSTKYNKNFIAKGLNAVKYFIESNKAEVQLEPKKYMSQLMYYITTNDVNMVKKLLIEGAKIQSEVIHDTHEDSKLISLNPLTIAVMNRNTAMVRVILENLSKQNNKNLINELNGREKKSSLAIAIDNKDIEIVELLLKYNANSMLLNKNYRQALNNLSLNFDLNKNHIKK